MAEFHLFARIRPCGLNHFEAVVTAVPAGKFRHPLASDRRSEVHENLETAETARDALLAELRSIVVGRGDSVTHESIDRDTHGPPR
jgi:hypothetical protein